MQLEKKTSSCTFDTLLRILQCIQPCLVLSMRPFVWGLPWRRSVMPKPRLTKENGALVLNLDLLPDVLVRKRRLLSPSFWLAIRVNRLPCFSFAHWDKQRHGREAMNSQVTFSRANGNAKYSETGRQGHRKYTHAVKSSDRNELTVKLHALLFKSKQCFTSGKITQRIDRKDLRMRMKNMQY